MKRLANRRLVSLALILTLVVLVLFPGMSPADQEDQKKMEAWIRDSLPKSEIEYEKITYGNDDFQARLQKVNITPKDGQHPLAIDEITFFKVDTDHNPPYFIKVSVRGIHVTPEHLEGDIRQTFLDRKIKEIPMDMDLDLTYDEKARNLDLNRLELVSEHYGRLSLSLNLDSFYLWKADNKTTFVGFLVGIPSIGFKSADMTFTDDGLVNFVVANRAKKAKKTEEAVLADMIGEVDQDIQKAKTENAKLNLAEVKKFLLEPGEIKVTVKPDNTIKIKDMKKIQGDVMDYVPLGLTVKANQ